MGVDEVAGGAFVRQRSERKSERHPEKGYEGAEEGRRRREWRWKRIVEW